MWMLSSPEMAASSLLKDHASRRTAADVGSWSSFRSRGSWKSTQPLSVPISQMKVEGEMNCLDTSSDAMLIATGDSLGNACIWNSRRGARLQVISCGAPVYSIDISADATMLATGDASGCARVWRLDTSATCVASISCGSAVRSVEISDDNETLACACEGGQAYVWEVKSGVQKRDQKF